MIIVYFSRDIINILLVDKGCHGVEWNAICWMHGDGRTKYEVDQYLGYTLEKEGRFRCRFKHIDKRVWYWMGKNVWR